MSDDVRVLKEADTPLNPACPNCGNTALGGLGSMCRDYTRLGSGGKREILDKYHRIHCPECDLEFAVLEKRFQLNGGDDA